jgi:hypothetical protein
MFMMSTSFSFLFRERSRYSPKLGRKTAAEY